MPRLPGKYSLFVFLLAIGGWLLSMGFAERALATCYCLDPAQCRCATAPPRTDLYPAEIGGVKVVCDTLAETTSVFTLKSPICGSSPEILPACAPSTGDPNDLTCYGTEFATGASTIPQEAQFQFIAGEIIHNGVSYGSGKNVTSCKSIAFCCNRSDIQCDDSNVPSLPGSCPDQNPNVIPPASICGVMDVPNIDPGPADSDGRIYFPHVRNTSSLTYLLQSLFRPISWTVADIVKNVITGKVDLHQGINDNTQVINKETNNASLIPGQPAPTPIFDFGSTTPIGTPNNGQCLITNVRTNPGDDLLGKQIYADLQYSQVYEYELRTDCLPTGSSVGKGEQGRCCAGTSVTARNDKGEPIRWQCDPDYVGLPTKGKVLVFTKSPFLEYLYQNLVFGPAAIYKRFVSQATAAEIEDTPASATIEVDSNPGGVAVADGAVQRTSQIYFPHLGSIYDYFLKNLQKLLRPKEVSDSTVFVPTTVYTPGQTQLNLSCTATCSYKSNIPESLKLVAAVAGEVYKVPPSLILGLLFSEGGLNQPIADEEVLANRKSGCSCPDSFAGACGPAQIRRSFFGTAAFSSKLNEPQVQALVEELGWQIGSPNRCNFSDAIFNIASKAYTGHHGVDYVAQCQQADLVVDKSLCEPENVQICAGVTMNSGSPGTSSCSDWDEAGVVTAARQYLGYCEESDHRPLYSYDVPRPICIGDANECYQQKLLNFLASNCTQTLSRSIPGGNAGNGSPSLTPSQLCANRSDGTYPLPANPATCVICQNNQVAGSLNISPGGQCPQ